MKTNILYSALFFIIISAFFSSCAFIQKEEFAQRRYYNFPRTNHSINPEKTDFTVSSKQKENATEENTKTPPKESLRTEPTITASAGDNPIINSKHQAEIVYRKNTTKENRNTITENSPSIDNPVFKIKKSEILKRAIKKYNDSKLPDPDTMLLVLVLVSLLVPPLAVYMKHNYRTNTWFWVTLVLWLLSIGVWFGVSFAGSSLWLAAAVIALLYIFDLLKD